MKRHSTSSRLRARMVTGISIAIILGVGIIVGALAAGYRPVVIQTGSMGETAPPNSLIVAVPRDSVDVVVGDILVMRRPGASPVTHRVIEIEEGGSNRFAITQGDANEAPDAAPYPLEGDQLVSRWIVPGLGGVIQSVFQPGVAIAVVALATLMFAFRALRSIWDGPTERRDRGGSIEAADAAPMRATRPSRDRRPLALVAILIVGVIVAGDAWALFVSTNTVAPNTFATAECFDAQLSSVQSGETIHAVDGTVSVPIGLVDPTTSFVMASIRSAANEPADSVVQVQLSGGGTSIDLYRSTDNGSPDPITVVWSIIEYGCGIDVQRGTVAGDGTNQLDVAIGAVDPAASFVLVSTAAEPGATAFDADDLFIAELTSPTNLRIRTTGAVFSAQRTFAWQVVNFADAGDAVVQTIAGTLGAGMTSGTISLPSPADPTTTFLLSNVTSASTGLDIGERMVRTHLLDANTVGFSRGVGGDPLEVSVQVVTLKDGSAVRHGLIDFTAGQPARTVSIEAVDPSRSTAISTVAVPGMTGGGRTEHATDDVVGEATATFSLTDAETVSIQRDATASNASFGWQVIEWAGPQWWDPTYTFRQRIDVDTGIAAAPDAYSVPLSLDHAALVTSGLSRSDGTDVRVLRWDGVAWTELDRVLGDTSAWNQVDTTVWFRTTDPIAAASTSTYWLYFGNNTPAPALADPEFVFLLSEDFESGTLGDFEDRTGGTGWYTADPWTRRIPITVPAGRVGADLTGFPLLVSLSVADVGANAQADGSDIRFTASDGVTPLPHEIETWNPAGGTLEAWVKVPTITSGSAMTIYLYYGAADAPSQHDVRSTWPSQIEAVWHLDRNPAGSAPQADDSTVKNHDGLSRGAMTSGDLVTGLVGGALDLDGVDDMVETDPFDIVGAGGLTLSGWVRLDNYSDHGRIITKADDPFSRVFELSISNTGAVRSRLSLSGSTQELEVGVGAVSLGTWHHVTSTWDGGTLRIYVDGAELGTMPAAGIVDSDSTMPITIGGITTSDKQIDGLLDEVRIETVSRPASWIGAAEANQRNPGAFHVVGAVESGSWFDQGAWGFRKPVVIDANFVTTDVSDFPLLVQMVDSDLQANAGASGTDLIFTYADGITRLDHVIESWNDATGALSAWVSVPLLSSTIDTQLFIYYGNASADDYQDPEAVFGPAADLAFLGSP